MDATEHLLRLADDFRPRRVDLGRANGRHFVFASGVGLDASVVKRVYSNPKRKARFGAWYYSAAGIEIFTRHYLVHPPVVRVRAGDTEVTGVTLVVQNADPFTYFRERPIRVAEDAGLETGSLSAAVLRSATPLELPTLIPRLLSTKAATVLRHRRVTSLPAVDRFEVEAVDGRAFPVQVDGDYIGTEELLEYVAVPGGLCTVA